MTTDSIAPISTQGSGPPEIAELSLAQVRSRRTKLIELEGHVSYWRRIIQARLDLLCDGSLRRGTTVDGLERVLSQQLGSNNRLALMDVQPAGGLPPIEGLGHLWSRGINPTPVERTELADDLRAAEKALSAHRNELFASIDALTAELIFRYRQCPELALSALPTRSENPNPL